MKCVCHEGTSILDGFSAIWFSFWIALNWIWNSLGLAFGLAFGSIVDYVLNNWCFRMNTTTCHTPRNAVKWSDLL